jgi:(S)-mandelate dehydrogenase
MSNERRAARAYSIEDLRRQANRRLPRAVFEFIDGGAEDERTLADNRAAFARWRFLPRVLVNVASVDLKTRILGAESALPIVIAPTGAVGFGRRGGDVMIARAAQAAGIPYTLSSTATASIEEVATAAPGRLWFQSYIFRKRDYTMGLVARAKDAGYEALVVTVDLPVGGKRERDIRNHFGVPFHFTRRNVRDFASRPLWALDMLLRGPPVMENLRGFTGREAGAGRSDSANAIAATVGRNYDPSFDWDALKVVREAWPRKFILKGIARPDDAERAVAAGCDAIVVSNHGGRQLDGAIATLDALPDIVAAVGDRIDVLIDGGIRRGTDIAKALALGAKGVLTGRATLFGACAAGEVGANRALLILRDELERTMQLLGARSIAEIDRGLLTRGP